MGTRSAETVIYANMSEAPHSFGRPATSPSGVFSVTTFEGHPSPENLRTLNVATSAPETLLSALLTMSPADYYEGGSKKLIQQDKNHLQKLFAPYLTADKKKKIATVMSHMRATPAGGLKKF